MCIPAAWAQETRGSIEGRVTDGSGAVIPGAAVSATNVEANITTKVTSNSQGAYALQFLVPGVYDMNVSAKGFKTSIRKDIRLPIHERLQVDFSLELGAISEQIEVTAEAPLLQAANSDLGVVIEARRISELPTAHGSPLSLMYLSPGVMVGQVDRAQQNSPQAITSDTDAVSVNGAPAGTTDYTIDGMPNTQTANTSNGSGAANSPPADIVEEFKLETPFDASVGHTSGTVVNVSLKMGTNKLHGSGYLFDREPDWNANTYFANRNGTPRGDFKYKRWGASLSGPVIIPRLYHGKSRTFFTYGYEGIDTTTYGSTTASVPDAAQASGDFSRLLALSSRYQIYDPGTIALTSDGRYASQPVPGNIIPANRISPIAKRLLTLYPKPNAAGGADGTNNFYTDNPSPETYYNHTARIDHSISDRNRIFGRFSYVHRITGPYRQYWSGPATGNVYTGNAPQVSLDDVYTLNSTTVLNLRYGFIRYSGAHAPLKVGVKVSDYGFPESTVAQLAGVYNSLPTITISGLTSFGNEAADYINSGAHSIFASVTKQRGSHNIRFGIDMRIYQETYGSYGAAAGNFTFGTNYTQAYNTSATSPGGVGQGLAALLFGQPTSGSISRDANQASQSTYRALYIHDTWRVRRRLNLDLGLRWENFGPTTERYNRAIRGFDPTLAQAIEAPAKAAYAARPDAALPVDQFHIRGGLQFAGVNGQPRTLWDRSLGVFAPRIGLAFRLRPRIVLRSGLGIYPIDTGVPKERRPYQTGYSMTTPMVPTLNNGQTFLANLAVPFPNGVASPTGSSLGMATALGQGLSAYTIQANTPYNTQWSFNTQALLPASMLLEVGYRGSRSVGLFIAKNVNALPNSYLSRSPFRDQDAINFVGSSVPSPLAGLLPNSSLNGATIPRFNLLRPYPQFADINMSQPQGYSWYHALQVRLERRFRNGFTIQTGYSFSRQMEAMTFLNAGDPTPYRSIATYDRPQQFSSSGIYELPFGRRRRYWTHANRVVNGLIGGWQVSAVLTLASGGMPSFGNVLFTGRSSDIAVPSDQRSIDHWFNMNAGFQRDSAQQLSYNLRTFPLRFSSIRAAMQNNWDASAIKKFRIHERYEVTFRAESFNALNHAWFSIPNTTPTSTSFGTVTATLGNPRNLQLGLKLTF
jgi:hypothetical protein